MGAEALQVDVELAVRELLAVFLRPGGGQCGLTHARGAGDDHDLHCLARGSGETVQHRTLVVATHEVSGARWQLGRPWRRDRGAWRRNDVLPLEDPVLGLAEFRAGFQTELVEEVAPRPAVDGERIRLPAAAVQRGHQ